MNSRFALPPGWSCVGELPASLDLTDLGEDILRVRSGDGLWTLDVGWYPEMDPNGGFVCKVIHGERWAAPVDALRTRDVRDVQNWLEREVERRSYLLQLQVSVSGTSTGPASQPSPQRRSDAIGVRIGPARAGTVNQENHARVAS